MNEEWHLNEYRLLRREMISRIKFLHQTLSFSIILQIALLMFGYYLSIQGKDIVLYLLLIPVLMNFLTFNYQSNQMSLEAIGKYIHEALRPQIKKEFKKDVWQWEQYFSNHKSFYKYEAWLKILPLLLPNVIPIIILIEQMPLDWRGIVILIFDFLLLLIVAANFRYKLRRVK
ncbi:MAG: hypothetical protein CEN88_169 [Candidatus Berkelbacteria bacterium Licking1014_2]|uniref:Uncharacterized protein n=1 Tax=Candidatus Berkelbacteria bacterium Licking1014_2 TaxID=2017146 RepID=A0A554LW77_9BACT|nr:MAG: hypothetical protein CEN88_169 [Candidatus Berkelbacteria bacterium Licking1014_2]